MIRRGVLLDVSEAAVLVDTVEDLCRRTGRQPSGRLGPILAKLHKAIRDASPPKTVTNFATQAVSREHSAYDLCTSAEAGKILGVSPHAVRALVYRDRLPAHHTGTRLLLPIRSVVARAERKAGRAAG